MPVTPSQEDYVEAIWGLIRNKGYARVSDIADRLGINSASVSKMLRKLDEDGVLVYEKYRGLNLTPEGFTQGQMLYERHKLLEAFLGYLGLSDGTAIHETVEGIEHHFSPDALAQVEMLVRYIQMRPQWWQEFLEWSERTESESTEVRPAKDARTTE